ncbi:MAG: hypothetical protein R3286_12420, partial [Gammaproteobacteria bacterium]|nr:hypothetical protein [Gammaproteobacteria bacterium]
QRRGGRGAPTPRHSYGPRIRTHARSSEKAGMRLTIHRVASPIEDTALVFDGDVLRDRRTSHRRMIPSPAELKARISMLHGAKVTLGRLCA